MCTRIITQKSTTTRLTINQRTHLVLSKNNFAPDKIIIHPLLNKALQIMPPILAMVKRKSHKNKSNRKQNTPNTSTPKYGYGNNNGEWGGYNKPQKEEQGAQSSNLNGIILLLTALITQNGWIQQTYQFKYF